MRGTCRRSMPVSSRMWSPRRARTWRSVRERIGCLCKTGCYTCAVSEEVPRLSEKEAVILSLLCGDGELYGLELVRRSDGKIKRGTVYVTLQRMAEKGYVSSKQEEKSRYVSGIPRRIYRASGLGERAYQSWIESGTVSRSPHWRLCPEAG